MPKPSSLQFFQAQASLPAAQDNSALLKAYLEPQYQLIESEYNKLHPQIAMVIQAAQALVELAKSQKLAQSSAAGSSQVNLNSSYENQRRKAQAEKSFSEHMAIIVKFRDVLELYHNGVVRTPSLNRYFDDLKDKISTCELFKAKIIDGEALNLDPTANLLTTLSVAETRLNIANADYKSELVLHFNQQIHQQQRDLQPRPIIVEEKCCTIM